MPYKSRAQAAYFNTHRAELERQGVNVDEWNQASKGLHLPKRETMKKDKGTEGLSESKAGEPKKDSKKDAKKGHELHSMHIRKTENGGHIVEHEYRDKEGISHPHRPEYAMSDIADLHDHIDEHLGGEGGQDQQEEAEGEGVGQAGDEQDQTGQTAAPEAGE